MISLLLISILGSGATWLGPAPKKPADLERVITIAPSLTETIVALGAGDRLVGVSRFDEQPEVAKVTRVGGFSDPSLETIIALKPDLVVVQKGPGNQKPVETLASLGIPVLALPLTTVEDTFDAMKDLGHVLGLDEKALALVNVLQHTRSEIRARGKARAKHPTVLLVYGFSPLVVAGPGSFAHELLEDCGALNAAASATTAYPTYSLEKVVQLAPDIIIDAAAEMGGRESVRALAPLKKTRWVTLKSKALLHPGPALGAGLQELELLLSSPM